MYTPTCRFHLPSSRFAVWLTSPDSSTTCSSATGRPTTSSAGSRGSTTPCATLEEHDRPKKGEPPWRFEIFRDDRELPGNQPLTEVIGESVRGSAVLVIVMSENYLAEDSNWCQRELDAFLQQFPVASGAGGRIFVVRRESVQESAGRPNSSNWSATSSGNSTRMATSTNCRSTLASPAAPRRLASSSGTRFSRRCRNSAGPGWAAATSVWLTPARRPIPATRPASCPRACARSTSRTPGSS